MDKCVGISDVGLAKIAVGCERLERLSLKWCMEISDLGVDLLCKKCFGLKALDVSYLKVRVPHSLFLKNKIVILSVIQLDYVTVKISFYINDDL